MKCLKVPFGTETDALQRLGEITVKAMSGDRFSPSTGWWGHLPCAAYRCRCGSWHLTSHPLTGAISSRAW